ncbi:CsxC family protein [Desulfotomaculum sp. 1211_IL3151]|uniref:CsxC family protein n=1 Tax=Desulfotomaculum sp. 1211_IL3151 TaxID=3084055 RepID=UPI002FD87C6C
MSNNDAFCKQACVKVIGGGSQPTCASTFPAVSIPVATLPVTVKIPVVISEITVKVNLDSVITLPEPALEIKNIKKRVKVTQCLLLQEPTVGGVPVETTTGTLFLKGFVRKNIDYATRSCSNAEGVCGDIRHCTVDVPYSCTTTIPFTTPPQAPIANTRDEFEFFRREKLPRNAGFAEKDHLLSGDFSEYNQVSEEFFTELPYCELINARIVEYDEYLNRTRPNTTIPFEEKEFSQVEEKMVLYITLKVLQNQQVPITNGTP